MSIGRRLRAANVINRRETAEHSVLLVSCHPDSTLTAVSGLETRLISCGISPKQRKPRYNGESRV